MSRYFTKHVASVRVYDRRSTAYRVLAVKAEYVAPEGQSTSASYEEAGLLGIEDVEADVLVHLARTAIRDLAGTYGSKPSDLTWEVVVPV